MDRKLGVVQDKRFQEIEEKKPKAKTAKQVTASQAII